MLKSKILPPPLILLRSAIAKCGEVHTSVSSSTKNFLILRRIF
jgi:hypothetical protein